MEIKASLNNLRIAPKKVRLVGNLVKGMPVSEADSQLKFCLKAAARPLRKLVASAVANATHNKHLHKEDLYIKSIVVNEGFVLKRWKPRAMGRANQIKKRSSLVSLTLISKEKAKKLDKPAKVAAKGGKK
ncbi:MAG: 50S ribosomal protein L22 [Patescibacteria group bacterium]|jgi:large subunit ribosomal protein L22